jgi:FkbM family methyltransferase
MLIPFENLSINKKITGVVHIGAHECEERDGYIQHFKLSDSNIIWVEAMPNKVAFIKSTIPNAIIFNCCVSDVDDQEVDFMVTNNGQSSSMLDLKTHKIAHPHVVEVGRIKLKTKKVDTLFKENGLDMTQFNFLNLDIQGAELLALRGSIELLKNIDYIYCEVNTDELYENCALLPELDKFLESQGFVRFQIAMTTCGWGDAFYVRID